ncbi:nucleotide-binding universal stress UspA family protein [Halohasta litchfieldiae]|jgi:nucleotide-binding universal stress UspA family protein|uniref:Nucleotide-binding universal stress protein, UspA family n=1 Tax=Halohasta litchfieldiae TaxID=1073996 RepID=A0A1H6TU72_9EURY|nr:universal stress protein [Halohasta litchfieldiae]ATW88860.1 nucleotide-binding universal stress UspA family protein [Halohasta litchfieldiae]SEI79745.1 Nucleotide-binding universal stress protein, UspA family [Halohasta litchfieldiae]
MFETILIATDGSDSVSRAVAVALDLADRFDGTVHALSVVDTDEVDSSPAAVSDQLQDALAEQADDALSTVTDSTDRSVETAVREGRPATEICDYAVEIDADMVATGTRGRHGENRFLIGSVAERVVRTCPVPVLTVRQLEGTSESEPVDA